MTQSYKNLTGHLFILLGINYLLIGFLFFFHFQERVTDKIPTKSAGKNEGQEKAEKTPWKLPVAIVVPSLVFIGN